MKRKGQKLTKQSFALLDRIKQRKEKKVEVVSESGLEELYVNVFGRSCQNIERKQIGNQIVGYVRGKEKEVNKGEVVLKELRGENKELREQIERLKGGQDQVGRIKVLNE